MPKKNAVPRTENQAKASDAGTRRDFLKTSGVLTTGAAFAGSLGIARSAYAQGGDLIKVALVGCGSRGQKAVRDRLAVGDNIKVVAIADAFERATANAANAFRKEESWKDKIDLPEERRFAGFDAYRKAIDCLGPGDEVLIATPPGFRPLHYRYAVDQGVHIFMEKPCCVDAPGFRSLMESNKIADDKNLKVLVGLQRRYDPGFRNWVAKIHEGTVGDVVASRVYWNAAGIWCRPRNPGESEMSFQMRNWYHFVWLCGDNICEQHVHNLDIGVWMHGRGDPMCHPVECNAMGGRQNQVCDEALRRSAPPFADREAWDRWYQANKARCKRHGQAWDHYFCEYTFADGSKMFSQCRHIANCFNAVCQYVHGTKGNGGAEGPANINKKAWLKDHAGTDLYATEVNSGQFAYEHVVHVNAIRGDVRMNYGWNGALSSMTAILGRMAAYSGQVVRWEDAVEKGGTYMPTGGVWDWDADPPVMPDADGFYESSVAKAGVYNPFA